MKLANWRRLVLGALVALSVAWASLAPGVAGRASACMFPGGHDYGGICCYRINKMLYCYNEN
jgi:hypothetical protein